MSRQRETAHRRAAEMNANGVSRPVIAQAIEDEFGQDTMLRTIGKVEMLCFVFDDGTQIEIFTWSNKP